MSAITRRRLLGAGAVVVVTAGAGVAIGALRPFGGKAGEPAPQLLVDAIARERTLIASIDLAVAADASLEALLKPIRADHTAHAGAVQDLVDQYRRPAHSVSTRAVSSPPGKPALLAAELAAQIAAASSSTSVTGETAVLLASIAACEAGHVALLS